MTPPDPADPEGSSGTLQRSIRWLFRNRRTGHLTVAQWPNVSLSAFLIFSIALRVFDPMGTARTVVRVLAEVALFTWALDELVRGVNPFRRILGLVVIIATAVSLSR